MDNQELPYRRFLETAKKVCETWYRICKDPTMWHTIDMCGIRVLDDNWQKNADKMEAMCRHAVDLGGDNIVHISLENFGSDSLLEYITKGSKRIERFRLMLPNITRNVLLEVAPKLTLLEDLELSYSAYTSDRRSRRRRTALSSFEVTEAEQALRYQFSVECPVGRSYSPPLSVSRSHARGVATSKGSHADGDAFAIAGTMHGLKQLQIVGNRVTNKGLQAILDGCPCLESLDLRRCGNLKVEGDLKRRCFQRIKQLQLPDDSTNEHELVEADKIVYKLYQSFFSGLVDYELTLELWCDLI